ncbi:unnamed protein product [Merluccius merluccius]
MRKVITVRYAFGDRRGTFLRRNEMRGGGGGGGAMAPIGITGAAALQSDLRGPGARLLLTLMSRRPRGGSLQLRRSK